MKQHTPASLTALSQATMRRDLQQHGPHLLICPKTVNYPPKGKTTGEKCVPIIFPILREVPDSRGACIKICGKCEGAEDRRRACAFWILERGEECNTMRPKEMRIGSEPLRKYEERER